MPEVTQVPLIVIGGLSSALSTRVSAALRDEHTAVLRHDLREIGQGVLLRTVRFRQQVQRRVVELAHGCVSCTLREDLLPALRRLAGRPGVRRIVLQLDPTVEPEAVCWALREVLVDGETLDRHVEVHAVLTTVDTDWSAQATGELTLAEYGLACVPDDDRTLAQLAVGGVEFADVLVHDDALAPRTAAVLDRLAPTARRRALAGLDPAALLDDLHPQARRGVPDGPHSPLLRGQPSLRREDDVAVLLFTDSRPFHPQRLYQAIDVLLDGVVRTRGRAWVASQPQRALWLESAGGALRVGDAGPWLAALDEQDWPPDAERIALAAAHWHPRFGDRAQDLVVITDGAQADRIDAALHRALLNDTELAAGERAWARYPDPFGGWREDPCGDEPGSRHGDEISRNNRGGQQR